LRERGDDVLLPVKVNLSLRVGPLRGDGFHELATVLVALPLGDELELEPAVVTRVDAPGLSGGDALVTRALALLAAQAGHDRGWRVRIDKRAPVGAGLGGGSADAGGALRLANATLAEPLDAAHLLAVAAQVGSDVPFFASGLRSALARGRGEHVEPCPLGAAVWAVLAWPGVALSTAEVYAAYRPGARASERVAELAAAPFAERRAERLAALVGNDLAGPAERLCPAAAALRVALLTAGALAATVSGSGSAVFGLFASEGAAAAAREQVARGARWTAIARLPQGEGPATIPV
jgi:4-diphosphocytidyl-2-C-methyl-D-erythritol kinase